jgi:3-hydroxybutyrate dehydrogenase
MADNYLVGKRALVTGSTQGIGFAIAKVLAGAGASIGLNGLATKEQIESTRAAIRDCGASEVRFFKADLTTLQQLPP